MTENEIAKLLSEKNDAFKKLGEEHKNLDEQLSELDGRVYLTPEEQLEKQRIKKLKLLKKDQMAEIIRQHKENHSN